MSRAQNIGFSPPATKGDAPPTPETGAVLLVLSPWAGRGRQGFDVDVYRAQAWGIIGEEPALRWVRGGAFLERLRDGARVAVIRYPSSLEARDG